MENRGWARKQIQQVPVVDRALFCLNVYYPNTQEAKVEAQRRRLKRYQDYLIGTSSSNDAEGDEINDLLNR